jgi:hypothetical protein
MNSMFTPTVTELTRTLEPVSPDTFGEALHDAPLDTPPALANVVRLRPRLTAVPGPGTVARAA